MDSARSLEVFENTINDLQKLYGVNAKTIICDAHPTYTTTRWASKQNLPVHQVFHHHAHASAAYYECETIEPVIIFTWDGVGYGSDGTLWGGEAMAGRPGAWNRMASFRTFKLVGGDKAGREPWRSAAALLWAAGSKAPASFADESDPDALHLAYEAWRRGINTFDSSAVGRLFDAAAALVLGRDQASFEGQGPMELEHIAIQGCEPVMLPLLKDDAGLLRSDWAPLLKVLADQDLPRAQRAGIFHETMAQALVDQALEIQNGCQYQAVGLSGGVFQNRRLTERVVEKLAEQGIEVRLHRDIPANDGGLCFGQVIEAAALANAEKE
jgi:hydrogenase maturation protein HypF